MNQLTNEINKKVKDGGDQRQIFFIRVGIINDADQNIVERLNSLVFT